MGRSFGSGSRSSGGRSFGSGGFGGSRSFGSGSFSRSRSFGGGSRSHGPSLRPSFRWRPHTTVVFGRSVYFGKGRSAAVSLVTFFIYIAIIAAVVCGFKWWDYQGSVDDTVDNYEFFHNVALDADGNENRQIEGYIEEVYPYKDTGMYFFEYYYYVNGVKSELGTSFCIYDKATIDQLCEDGKVILAINATKDHLNSRTSTIPLDHKDMELEDDVWYLDDLQSRNLFRMLTFIAGGVAVALFVGSLVLSVTAKKATKEQIEETEQAKSGTQNNQQNKTETPAGAWRCAYCNTLNDSSKEQCDGCGASR